MTVSFWIPVDYVPIESSLRIIKASHKWTRRLPQMAYGEDFYKNKKDYIPAPDPDENPTKYKTLQWK